MEISIERKGPPLDGWSVNGIWWRADEPATTIGGVLEYDPRYGAALNIAGGLVEVEGTPLHHVICGDAEGRRYTLIDGRWQGSTAHGMGPDARVTSQKWASPEVLVGAHVPGGSEAQWLALDVETRCLPSWAGTSRSLRFSHDTPAESTFNVSTPEPILVDLADIGSFEFWWRYTENHSFFASKVAVVPSIRIALSSPMTLEQARADVLTPLLQLTTLLTGHIDSVTSMQATNDDAMVEVHRADRRSPLGPLEVHPTSQPASLEYLAANLHDAMERWFEMHEAARSSLVDLFAPPWIGTTVEVEFQRVCRSAESFHRFVFGGAYMDTAEFERLRAEVRGHLDGPGRQLFDMRLQYGNELTLKQRIDALIGMCATTLQAYIGEYDNFSRGVVGTRNALTHSGTLNEETFNVSEVYWATETLRLVLTVVLLARIGLDPDVALESALRDSSARQVLSTSNSLRYWRQIQGTG